jgi:hypothetical protein
MNIKHELKLIRNELNCRREHGADGAQHLAFAENKITELCNKIETHYAGLLKDIEIAILANNGGVVGPTKEIMCKCDSSVGYYCEYCAISSALCRTKKFLEELVK